MGIVMNEEIELREKLEIRIVALLLGEASAFETAELEEAMQRDPELVAFHSEMRRTIELTREASKQADTSAEPAAASLKLSPERREALLAHFRQTKLVSALDSQRKRAVRRWLVPVTLAAGITILVSILSLFRFQDARKLRQLNAVGAPDVSGLGAERGTL